MKAMLQEKEINSLNHCNFVHNFIVMLEAIKMPDANRHGSTKASKGGKTMHFIHIIDYPLSSRDFGVGNTISTHFPVQRSCFPRRNVKDDSNSSAVFTEQGSSTS